MAISQRRSKRKPSGGMYKRIGRKEKQHELGRLPAYTGIGKLRSKLIRGRSNNLKARVLAAEKANLYIPSAKKYEQVAIKTVKGNPANRHFIRRNIITKGSVIDTEKGLARVTSRPGQDGVVNAVLIS